MVARPAPAKPERRNVKQGYVRYERSPTAHRLMAHICNTPGLSVAELSALMGHTTTYFFITCLLEDGYVETTQGLKSNNVQIRLIWPTELFLAKFPRNPVASATISTSTTESEPCKI